MEKLIKKLENNKTLLTGLSGVGKSSIINRIVGKEVMKIIELTKQRLGKHTITNTQIIPFNGSTILIDSPGFNEFHLWGIAKEELQFYFPDFEPYFQNCMFQP